jgi:hypothetical protein
MCWSKIKTSFGLKVDNNKVPGLPGKDIYERALTLFVEESVKKMSEIEVRKALSTVTVEWWDKIAPRPSTGEVDTVVVYNDLVYSGLALGDLCKIAWRGKLWRSAFCHELLHVIGGKIFGTEDPEHSNILLWKELEPAINLRLSNEKI